MSENRTQKSIKNTTVSLISQIASVVTSFIVRTFFIKYLGNSYLGISGLFSNILSLLSFAELGIGTAIIYAMYKPIAQNDEKKICALMNFYEMVYRCIGIFIMIAGIILIPFLNFFVGDTSQVPVDLPPLSIIYLLYLINTVSSYFFNYKRSLIIASQNSYIDSINQLCFGLIRNFLQIFILLLYKSFTIYLIIQIACTIVGNISISIKANKLFPYLKQNKKERLELTTIKEIIKNVMAMACHKLGSVVISGTDNILITKFVSLVATGQYSNYVLLTSTVRTLYLQILTPITASIGNLNVTENKEKSYVVFNRILFVNSYIAIFCTTCLLSLSNSFINLFWGKDSVFSLGVLVLILINFYINCIRKTAEMYIDTVGLFWQIRWKSIIESIINLIASLYFVLFMKLGVAGVILGTIISNVLTNLWWEPYVVFKYYFNKPLYYYFAEYVKYFVTLVLSATIAFVICASVGDGFISFCLKCFIATIIPNVIIFFVFRSKTEYNYFLDLFKKTLSKLRINLMSQLKIEDL